VAARPPAVRVRATSGVLLACSLAGIVGFSLLAAPGAVALAVRQSASSCFLDLGPALVAWQATSGWRVAELLWLDLGLIASNALLIALLNLWAIRHAGGKVLSARTWSVLMATGSLLLVADVAENVFTRGALGLADGASPFFWTWLVALSGRLASALAHVASWLKLGLAAVYVSTLAYVLCRGFGRAASSAPSA
jgi:hypothetical protein